MLLSNLPPSTWPFPNFQVSKLHELHELIFNQYLARTLSLLSILYCLAYRSFFCAQKYGTYIRYLAIFMSACAPVSVWEGLGTSQWQTAGTVWFVRYLAAKGSQAMPVQLTIDSRGTTLVTQAHERAPEARECQENSSANYEPDKVRIATVLQYYVLLARSMTQ